MVRKILRLLGSRYGIAALLLLIVIAVVGIAKATTDPSPGDTPGGGEVESFSEGAPDDGVAEPSQPGEGPASASQESQLPQAALDAGKAFATAWVDSDRSKADWYAAVSEHASDKVREEFAETDPSRVPATEIRDEPVATGTSVEIKTDKGLLILEMLEKDGKWYVDGVDFQNP
jgi:hypothetical protein